MRLTSLDDTALHHVATRYYDGPHYDRRYASYVHDVDFWTAIAESSGRHVLELAAGTGRLSIPMAERGLDVTGMDIAPAMLAQATANARGRAAPTFLLGDMRDFDLDRRFDLVMIACSSFSHLLNDRDALLCLTTAQRHLAPGGTFAMDLVVPARMRDLADGQWRYRFGYPDPAGTGQVTVRGTRNYDPATRLLTDDLAYHFSNDGREERFQRVSRMYDLQDLRPLLARTGLRPREIHGGFDGEPLTDGSATQVIICGTGRGARAAG